MQYGRGNKLWWLVMGIVLLGGWMHLRQGDPDPPGRIPVEVVKQPPSRKSPHLHLIPRLQGASAWPQ